MSTAAAPYLYVALTPSGGKRWGMVRGRDARHATEQLRRQRLVPLKTWQMPAWAGGGDKRPSLADQAELHLQLSQLLGRGVPLIEAMDVSVRSVSATSRPRVERMRELVAAGSSFAEACARVDMFDPVTIAVYRAAERTGDLGGAAKQLSMMARRTLQIRGRVGTLMLYPLIVMSVSIVAGVFLLVYVVPKVGTAMKDLATSNGTELPLLTRVVMAAGFFIQQQWVWCLAGAVVLAVLIIFLRRTIASGSAVLARKLPVLREVILAQESARFFTVMTAMSRNGVPLADALGTVNTTISHPLLRTQLENLRTRLVEGGVLRQLIDTVTALPVGTRRLLIAAERSGDMETAFETLAADMTEELDRRTSRLLAVVEPVLIIVMTLFIGSLLISLLLPMFSMTGQVG
ncbi:MAG: type II secretion system F family protein [Phycisphaerales bacterium]